MTGEQGWAGVTDLADQAVVLPLALLVLVALLSRGRGGRGLAAGWALAVGGVLLALLALKLWAGACAGGGVLRDAGLRSPSGHAAAGGIVYGGLLALALRRGARASALCCLAAAAGFGASRLALGVHTPADVAVGCAVAAAGGAVLGRGWRGGGAGVARRGGGTAAWAWGATALALVWVLHGRRLGAEPVIAAVATHWLRPLCGW